MAVSGVEWMEKNIMESYEKRLEISLYITYFIKPAINKFPDFENLRYLYDYILYNHPERKSDNEKYINLALEQFSSAIDINSTFEMAKLYNSHCLHDLNTWQEAYQSYKMVDCAKFAHKHPEWVWRIYKLQEQIALCLAKTGNIQGAEEILNSYFGNLESLSCEESDEIVDLDGSVSILTEISNSALLLERPKRFIIKFNIMEFYNEKILYPISTVVRDKTFVTFNLC
jgi:tetratricopeptide (TPR) repeat protein